MFNHLLYRSRRASRISEGETGRLRQTLRTHLVLPSANLGVLVVLNRVGLHIVESFGWREMVRLVMWRRMTTTNGVTDATHRATHRVSGITNRTSHSMTHTTHRVSHATHGATDRVSRIRRPMVNGACHEGLWVLGGGGDVREFADVLLVGRLDGQHEADGEEDG